MQREFLGPHELLREEISHEIRTLTMNPSSTSSAKRYERMMKAHGISPGTPPARSTPAPATARREDPGQAKKRKLEQFAGEMENSAVDDDGGIVGIKDEFGPGDISNLAIKEEDPDSIEIIDDAMPFFSASGETSYNHQDGRSDFSSYVPAFHEYGFESFHPQVQHSFPLKVGSSAGGKAAASGDGSNDMVVPEAILISD